MKIALVNSSHRRVVSSPPLGLLSIAAVLQSDGHNVKVYDVWPENNSKKLGDICRFKPDIVAISVSTFQFQSSKSLIRTLKKKLRNAFFVGGGVHVSSVPEHSLANLGLDCCVVGEGEITFPELCKALSSDRSWQKIDGLVYSKDGKAVKNRTRAPITNLDTLPFLARHLLPMEKYLLPGGTVRGRWLDRTMTVFTSRGCPGRCIFCASKILFGRRMRRRSVENVIDEIRMLKRNYKVTSIYFMDDTFTLNKPWVTEFCKRLIEEDMNIEWACQARVGTLDEDILELMERSGLIQIEFGIESGSEKVLKTIKKDINIKQIEETIGLVKTFKIKVLVTFILGMPGEDESDIDKTLDLARRINADHYEFYFAEPFPGTELLSIAREKDLLLDGTVPEDGKFPNAMNSDFRRIKPSMKSNLEPDRLVEIRNRIHKEFPRFTFWERMDNVFHVASLLLRKPKITLGSAADYLRKPGDLRLHVISRFEKTIRDEIH